MPGVTVAVVEDGEVVWTEGFGVPADTEFQAGSISKPVAAASVLALADEGVVDLDEPVSTTAESLEGSPVRQSLEPGHYSCSGGGCTIAQQVVEDVTGQPFADVARREVLDPLGMTASGYDCAGAPGYRYAEAAAAGLCSTAADLARFAVWLGSDDPRAELMREPAAGTDGHYGLGLELDDAPTVRHPGVNRGYHAELLVDPDAGVGLVVLTDGDRGGEVVDAVLRAWQDAG